MCGSYCRLTQTEVRLAVLNMKRKLLSAALSVTLVSMAGCRAMSGDERIAHGLREGLMGHSRSITINFESRDDLSDDLADVTADYMEKAMAESDDPKGGDYIRYQNGGYTADFSVSGTGPYSYSIRITPKYYDYLEQEQRTDETVSRLMDELDLEDASDLEKMTAVYDYICSHVTYDRVHAGNGYYYLRSTCYSALVRGTATCQGYAVAVYRLMKECGIECRVVTGRAAGEDAPHAWNIVKLGGEFYFLDAAWDSQREEHDYFLKGMSDLEGHELSEEFMTDEFMKAYPIAENGIIS